MQTDVRIWRFSLPDTHDKLNLRLWTNQQNDIINLIHRNFNIFQGLKERIYFSLSGAQ